MRKPGGQVFFLLMTGLGLMGLTLIGGCLPFLQPELTATPTLTATVTLIPSVTPIPTSTDTPYPTWTLVPSLTPTSTATLTPTPTQTATPGWCNSVGLVRTPVPAPQEPGGGSLRVAYLRDGDLWLWEEGQPSRKLTSQGDIQSLELSSDGRQVAYLRPADPYGSEIWLYNLPEDQAHLLAGQERLLALAGDAEALGVTPHHLSWVPGRSRLAFNARPVWPEIRDYIPDDLWLLEIPSGQLHNILPDGQGGEFTFSPDGLNVAVGRPERLDIFGSSGESPRRNALPGYHGVGLGTEDYYPKPFWARDSRSMRLAIPEPLTAVNPNPEVGLWELPSVGASPRRLGTITALPPSVIFSPDLARAAYLNWPDLTPHIKELNLADMTGKALTSAIYQTGQDLEFLGWSPDSDFFAFWLPASRELRLGRLCEPAGRMASELGRLGALRWVDSTRFLFTGGDQAPARLFLGRLGAASLEIGPVQGTLDFDFTWGG